jgi:polar amino acid transport system substrate-binding protein
MAGHWRRRIYGLSAALLGVLATPVRAADPALLAELAPTRYLRVAIAVAPAPSAFWAVKDPATGEVRGVTVELGRALANAADVPVRFVVYPSSGEIAKAGDRNEWDVTFAPVDDERRKEVAFGAPYHLLESTYLAAPNCCNGGVKVVSVTEANSAGVRIAGVDNTTTFRASKASAPLATHSTVANVDEALGRMREGKIDLIALSRESLSGLAAKLPGSKVADGAFLRTTTAAAVPNGRERSRAFVSAFIEEAKDTGLVRRSLNALGLSTSVVAPRGMAP